LRYLVILWASLAVVACKNEPSGATGGAASSAGCSKDTDCKGTRVCEIGQCVESRAERKAKDHSLDHYTDMGPPVPRVDKLP
jgi:hypothetical protein